MQLYHVFYISVKFFVCLYENYNKLPKTIMIKYLFLGSPTFYELIQCYAVSFKRMNVINLFFKFVLSFLQSSQITKGTFKYETI